MSFIRKVKRKGRVYLAEVENRRINVLKEMQRIKIETHEMAIDKYSMSFEPAS